MMLRSFPRAALRGDTWAALIGLAALIGCEPTAAETSEDEDTGPKAGLVAVEVLSLAPEVFDDRVEATGNLEADNDATLSAQSAGTLQSVAALGTRVRKGQVVARIDPAIPVTGVKQAEASLAAARANLELSKQTLNRQRPLHKEGVISDLEFQSILANHQQAQAQLAQAEATLAQARESLENTRIVAPFAGVVDQRFYDLGEQVMMGTQVARVIDGSTLIVKAGLPERYAAEILVGAEVEVQLPAYGLEPRKGRVRFVATGIDPRSRTFEVEIELDNRAGKLKPEMVAKVVVTRARMEDVLVVPEDAVMRDEQGLHVFVVQEEDDMPRARRRGIEAKGRGGGRVVVEGVSIGDKVVVVGQSKLIDGDYVSTDAGADQ